MTLPPALTGIKALAAASAVYGISGYVGGMTYGLVHERLWDKSWSEAFATGHEYGTRGMVIGAAMPWVAARAQLAGRGIRRVGQRVGQSWSRFMSRGPGRRVGFGRKLLRAFWEDRRTFNASREFFRRWRRLFGENTGPDRWSLEHNFIKRRWYEGANPVFRRGTLGNKMLQSLGDSGMNLAPMPVRMNIWLDHHRMVSAAFNWVGVPVAGAGVIYGGYRLGRWAGESLAEWLMDWWEEP